MLVEQRQAEKPEVRECAEGHDKDVSGRAHATGCRDASAQAGEADSRLADASDSRCQEHPRANGVPIREIEGLDVPRSANGFFFLLGGGGQQELLRRPGAPDKWGETELDRRKKIGAHVKDVSKDPVIPPPSLKELAGEGSSDNSWSAVSSPTRCSGKAPEVISDEDLEEDATDSNLEIKKLQDRIALLKKRTPN